MPLPDEGVTLLVYADRDQILVPEARADVGNLGRSCVSGLVIAGDRVGNIQNSIRSCGTWAPTAHWSCSASIRRRAHLARARLTSVEAIPRLRAQTARRLHEAAKISIGSLAGPVAETIVRTVVDQVRFAQKLKRQFERLLVESYRSLPVTNHLDSIIGFGEVTAAVLTAKIVSIDRFDRPEQLVGYFGIFPEEKSSGIGPDGSAHPRRKTRMCQKGDDLVRRYLFIAAMSAVQSNPAVRPLYHRLRARGAGGKVALGHAMRKLLHLAFAVWKSGQPFDPQHYPWDQTRSNLAAEKKEAAGHNQEASPDEQVVTATPTETLSPPTSDVNTLSSGVDFQSVRPRLRSSLHSRILPRHVVA